MDGDLDTVIGHYETEREEDRLATGLGELELIRTQEVLRRYLPPPPSRILDVGGATGVHAAWLLDAGYQVHLVDIAPRHVRQAEEQLGAHGLSADLGDARHLQIADHDYDVGLLLGPLYHLVERSDRIAALREAGRVVRPGGMVAVAAVSRFASLFDGLRRGFLFEAEFRKIVAGDLADGRHRNESRHPHWFTTAFFHHPDELAAEIHEAGLSLLELVGVEGMAFWVAGFDDRWADPADREIILDSARAVESEPTLLGLSPHLLAVARTPDD